MVDEKLKTSFGKLSKTYDDVRPDYHEELITDVIQISGISSHGKILEIGTGTGKATKPFAEKGYKITALDISKEQMSIAKRNLSQFPNINYIVTEYEKADLPINQFDLVFAAQTFHWINPEIGYKKTSEILKDSGYLALFSNFQSRHTILEQQVRDLYTLHCPDYPREEYGTLNILQSQFEGSYLFEKIERRTYTRVIEYTREKYIKLISSFSWVSTLSNTQKHIFFEELGKILGENKILNIPTESILLIAKKK